MASYSPKKNYQIVQKQIAIEDFHKYSEDFVVRPPYQRKAVWSQKKQRELLDSLFRRFYIPRLVLRIVRLDDDREVKEVIDGQQRINTVQRFFNNELKLPDSLGNLRDDLPGSTYEDLPTEVRKFVDRDLDYDVDIVHGIDDPEDPEHQRIAAEIFWRLQQGESLTYMEIAHSRLSSLARNFVVRFADDITFDFDRYQPRPRNTNKHEFFHLIARKNNRMQHLALLTRFLILEENDGPADIKDTDVQAYIDQYKTEDGIANFEFEDYGVAEKVLETLDKLADVFRNDLMVKDGEGEVQELKTEYFVISIYLLARHLNKHYVFDEEIEQAFHSFTVDFHDRWKSKKEEDHDVVIFSDNRQQSAGEIEVRDRIMRQNFFDYILNQGLEILTKDKRRSYSEAERIELYRDANGFCHMCLAEDKPEDEAIVPWDEYEADHVVPHSQGGETSLDNAQLLCRYHNRSKSDRRVGVEAKSGD